MAGSSSIFSVGNVNKIVAGAGISVSPGNGKGTVTITATAVPGSSGEVVTDLADVTLDVSVPSGAVNFWDTNPTGWNAATGGKQTVEFDFYLNNLFTLNPDCHFGVILRSDPAGAGSYVNGHGLIVGSLASNIGVEEAPNVPLVAMETWYGPTGGNYVWKNAEVTRKGKFTDGSDYRVRVESTVHSNGDKYVRGTMWKKDTSTTPFHWENIFESGDNYDHNALADFTKSGVSFFVVFGAGPSYTLAPGSSLDISNVSVTWGPAGNTVPDVSSKLSRYGASLDGDITFVTNSRRIKVTNSGSPTNWTAFQAKQTNSPTSVLAIPNGTSTSAEFFATNNSDTSSAYSGVVLGASTTKAYLSTYNIGTANYDLDVNIGAGNTVGTFNYTGFKFTGASKNLNTSWTNLIHEPGGPNAVAFVNSPSVDLIPLEWWCTAGNIASFLPTNPVDTDLETVLRPLYCMFSAMYKELLDKKLL